MRLREILQIPAFSEFRVVAGHGGLGREVSTVSVMDAPDIYEWMRGGELLITSGYVMKDDPEYITTMVEKLDEWGASAFGVKLGRFIDEMPQSAIREAEARNFPLLSIPVEFAFTEVINPVLQEVINRKSREMIYTENIHREFIRMAVEEKSIAEILQMLERYILRSVVYFDITIGKAYYACDAQEEPLYEDMQKLSRREQSLQALLMRYDAQSIKTNGEEYGYLFFGERREGFEPGMQAYYQIATEQAAIVLILKIQKLRAERRIEGNYRELFVEDLLKANFRTREEIANRARIYGWDFTDGGYAVILKVEGMQANYMAGLDKARGKSLADAMEKITRLAERQICQSLGLAVYRWGSDQVLFAICAPYPGKEQLHAQCRAALERVQKQVCQQTGLCLSVGVGSYKEDFYQVCESYQEAGKALNLALEQGGTGNIAFYDDLGVMKLLSLVCKSEEAKELCEEYLQKLRVYDREHEGTLLETMQAVVSCEWNLKKASERLYIHYNSMKYRYRRICQILNKSFDSADEKLNMEIALKMDAILRE